MIVETNAFRDFDDARKFCCHAGVAPFTYESGSSVRSRSRVSHRADKSIQSLLHRTALSVATRRKGELSDYYLRKVAEGKNTMPVINAVRAKLVLRMFAVIKNDAFYEKNDALCLHKA
jgi:transposase